MHFFSPAGLEAPYNIFPSYLVTPPARLRVDLARCLFCHRAGPGDEGGTGGHRAPMASSRPGEISRLALEGDQAAQKTVCSKVQLQQGRRFTGVNYCFRY